MELRHLRYFVAGAEDLKALGLVVPAIVSLLASSSALAGEFVVLTSVARDFMKAVKVQAAILVQAACVPAHSPINSLTFGAATALSQPVSRWPQSPVSCTTGAWRIPANSMAGLGFDMWSCVATMHFVNRGS